MKVDKEILGAENLTNHLTDYAETYLQLGLATATQKASTAAASAAAAMVLGMLCLFVLLFAGLGSAIWLGDYLQNSKAGYFLVAGFYAFVTGLFLVLNRSTFSPWLRDLFIRKVYE